MGDGRVLVVTSKKLQRAEMPERQQLRLAMKKPQETEALAAAVDTCNKNSPLCDLPEVQTAQLTLRLEKALVAPDAAVVHELLAAVRKSGVTSTAERADAMIEADRLMLQ